MIPSYLNFPQYCTACGKIVFRFYGWMQDSEGLDLNPLVITPIKSQ